MPVPLYDANGRLEIMKPLSRKDGKSLAAKVAYNSSSKLQCGDTGKTFDYTRKKSIWTKAFGPEGAPEWIHDHQELVRRIEQSEKRKDARLVREIIATIPREIPEHLREQVLREFAQGYVDQGAVAVVSYHNTRASDGGENPHGHILLTLRELDPSTESGFSKSRNAKLEATFGGRARGRNPESSEAIKEQRRRWADHLNGYLRKLDADKRVCLLSKAQRGLDPARSEPKITEQGIHIARRYGINGNSTIEAVVATRKENKAIRTLLKQEIHKMSAEEKSLFVDHEKENIAAVAKAAEQGKEKKPWNAGRQKFKMQVLQGGALDLDERDLSPGGFFYENTYSVRVSQDKKRLRVFFFDGSYIDSDGKLISYSGGPGYQAHEGAKRLSQATGLQTYYLAPQMEAGKQGAALGLDPNVLSPNAVHPPIMPEQPALDLVGWWQEQGYHDVIATPKGVLISLSAKTKLLDKGSQVDIEGKPSPEALRALTHKAQTQWNGRIELYGSAKFKAAAWLQCQRDGVEVVGYKPPQAVLLAWKAEQAARRSESGFREAADAVAKEVKNVKAAASDPKMIERLSPAMASFIRGKLDKPEELTELAGKDTADIAANMKDFAEEGRKRVRGTTSSQGDNLSKFEELGIVLEGLEGDAKRWVNQEMRFVEHCPSKKYAYIICKDGSSLKYSGDLVSYRESRTGTPRESQSLRAAKIISAATGTRFRHVLDNHAGNVAVSSDGHEETKMTI